MAIETEPNTVVGLLAARIWARKWSFVVAALIGGVVLFAVSFLMPVRYRAQTRVIPASLVSEGSGVPIPGSIMNLAQSAGLTSVPGGSDPSNLIPEIIKSADFTSRILATRFLATGSDSVALIDVLLPETATDHRVAEAHRTLVETVLGSTYDVNSGVTTISAVHADPVFAAALVNGVAGELDAFHLEMQTSQARYESVFISERLDEVESALERAENTLRDFREENRTIATSPQLMLESGRLERELALQQDLFITLKTQEELARIQVLKSVPNLRILEKGSVPYRKHSPRRGIMVLAGMLIGAAAAMGWVLLRSDPRGS